MTARFILSLDCEGKWGVADLLQPDMHRTLSDERLRRAYRAILDLLDEFQIPATFAFVGLFGETGSSLQRLRPELERFANRVPHYVGAALKDMNSGSGQGWSGDWAVEWTGAARTAHEIGLHGVTHVPWTWMDGELLQMELDLFRQLESPVGTSRTFIYPRNEVAHVDALGAIGIEGYRLAPAPRSRPASLLSELNIAAQPEADTPAGRTPREIPAGYFVNWQSGPRRLVPIALSALRARRMLERADRLDRVVHFWAHPENFASAPKTLDLLREILISVAKMRDAGRCTVMTQIDYCRAAAKAEPAAAA